MIGSRHWPSSAGQIQRLHLAKAASSEVFYRGSRLPYDGRLQPRRTSDPIDFSV